MKEIDKITEALGEFTLPAGTVIHFNRVPFYLAADTRILGVKENFALAKRNVKGKPLKPKKGLGEP